MGRGGSAVGAEDEKKVFGRNRRAGRAPGHRTHVAEPGTAKGK